AAPRDARAGRCTGDRGPGVGGGLRGAGTLPGHGLPDRDEGDVGSGERHSGSLARLSGSGPRGRHAVAGTSGTRRSLVSRDDMPAGSERAVATIGRMEGALTPTDRAPARSGPWVLGLLAIAVPLLLFRLGAKDVWEASEGRPLESAREMRAHGDYL